VAVDLTVLGLLATHLAAGWHHPVPLMAVAVAASLLRMAVAAMAIHRLRQCAQ
jgi:hypothetical protein